MYKLISLITVVLILVCAAASAGPARVMPARGADQASAAWECYDDGSPDPCHNDLNAITFVSGTDGWAVGDGGILLRWDGSTWSKFTSPTTARLAGVVITSPTDGWIVGGYGDTQILRWDGSQLAVHAAPDGSGLTSVAAVSPTDIWAVGFYGQIVHWDGVQWSDITSPTSSSLRSISMVSATDGWAVGDGGTLLHWASGAWSTVTSPTTEPLYSISMASTSMGFAVSWWGTMLRWNGKHWSVYTQDTGLNGITFVTLLSPTDGWALGQDANANGTLTHWDGVSWHDIGMNVYDILMGFAELPGSGGAQGWAVGWNGRLAKWDGARLSPVPDNNTVNLKSVKMISPGDGWAVGEAANGPAPVFHWDGSSWSWNEEEWLSDVDFVSKNLGWAVGSSGNIQQWNGAVWTEITRTQTALNDLGIVSAADIWAVGGGGGYECRGEGYIDHCSSIVHWDGSQWSEVPNPATYPLMGVAMLSATDGWAVGNTQTSNCAGGGQCSILLHWDVSQWISVTSPVAAGLNAIAFSSATDGWIVGDFGHILRWNGASWAPVSSPTDSNLYGITMLSPTQGWIVGGYGTILSWDGTHWEALDSPTGKTLQSVSASTKDAWAVGESGIILHYAIPQAALNINFHSGAPGSFFNVTGVNFPAGQTAAISVNGHSVGSALVGGDGTFTFTLATSNADEGVYDVTASVYTSAMVKFILDIDSPTRGKEGSYPQLDVPAGIAITHEIFLPAVNGVSR